MKFRIKSEYISQCNGAIRFCAWLEKMPYGGVRGFECGVPTYATKPRGRFIDSYTRRIEKEVNVFKYFRLF